eukprot:scaffold64866_cov65-Phaeocystis_antarctica.AAC.7
MLCVLLSVCSVINGNTWVRRTGVSRSFSPNKRTTTTPPREPPAPAPAARRPTHGASCALLPSLSRLWATLDAPHPHTLYTHTTLPPRGRVSNEAAERVVRVKLLALQLEARRGRGVVGLEPLLDGAALVREAIRLYKAFDG